MSLTLGTGPLGRPLGGAFNFSLDDAPRHRILFEDYPVRLRAKVGDAVVVDTVGAKLLHETAIMPVVYVPLADSTRRCWPTDRARTARSRATRPTGRCGRRPRDPGRPVGVRVADAATPPG